MSKRSENLGYKVALGGLLVAMMLILGYVETLLQGLVPTGIPGIKLGISNGVLLFALYMMDVRSALIMMVLKVGLSGLLFGNPMTMLFALCGGALSLAGMIPLSRVKGINIITVSMVGAVLHNLGQVLLAMLILETDQLIYYMAILLLVGLACGAVTGIAARATISHMKKLRGRGQ